MPEKKIILLDMDGVLCDYDQLFYERVAEAFPELAPRIPEARRHWDGARYLAGDNKKLKSELEKITLRPGFFADLPPIPGALEAVETLRAHPDLAIKICTAPKKIHCHCVPEKYAWVERYLGRTMADNIIMTRDKTLVDGAILVDDKPYLRGLRADNPPWKHVLYDRPYNRDTPKPRIHWEEDYLSLLEAL